MYKLSHDSFTANYAGLEGIHGNFISEHSLQNQKQKEKGKVKPLWIRRDSPDGGGCCGIGNIYFTNRRCMLPADGSYFACPLL